MKGEKDMNYFRERMSEGTGTKKEQIAKLKRHLFLQNR